MGRLGARVVVAVVLAGLAVGACLGTDPTNGETPDADAGPDAFARENDADTLPDGGGDAPSPQQDGGGDATASDDAGFDAGPPAWTATLATGTGSILSTASSPSCLMQLIAIDTGGGPPLYQLYVQKSDATPATCNEPKGPRSIGSTYALPSGRLLKPTGYDRLVVAFTAKLSASGSSPTGLYMKQIDWWSGNDMHQAIMKTKDIPGVPVTETQGLEQLFFGDQVEQVLGTVRVKGTGNFPGATGTGTYFFAVYENFIGERAQPASAANTATRAD